MRLLSASMLVVSLFLTTPLSAQLLMGLPLAEPTPVSATGGAFGGATGVVSISAASFTGFDDTTVRAITLTNNRWYISSGSLALDASVSLETGVSIVGIEVDGCDPDTSQQFFAGLIRFTNAGGRSIVGGVAGVVQSGGVAVPGCGTFSATIDPPLTVTNAGESFVFEYGQSASSLESGVGFVAARVRYKRQVSPPPASATFADVPTSHGFFKFVEALAAAGITGGCGGGNFCPDNPVTRGQMAVFLASALGLHWPN